MKILIAFPPIWDINLAPMLSLPMLSGMLKDEGHDVEIMDINSTFMNFILSKKFLDYFKSKTDFYLSELEKFKNIENTTKYQNISHYYVNIINIYRNGINFLKDMFEKYPSPQKNMEDILISSAFELNNYFERLRSIVNNIFNKCYQYNIPRELSFFYDWEQEHIIKNIEKFSPDLIGFSIYSEEQFEWMKKFSENYKETINIPYVFGGTWITTARKNLNKDFFIQTGVKACIYGEGEPAFKGFGQNKSLEKIPNIIYLDENEKIQVNTEEKAGNFQFYKPNYSGIKLSEYFIPKTVLPVESSRGCYWSRCEFCTFMDCISYKQKNVDDFIEEIKEYVYKYNVNHFFFTDAAIHPEYAREFSTKLLENNLNIYYVTFLRLEKAFNQDLLKLMFDAGLRIAMWGVESGSDRILQLYKKGTTVDSNRKILELSHNIGIYNYCWLIVNFPTETIEDLNKTRNFLFENYNNIDYISIHDFTLYKNSPIASHPEDFGLDKDLFLRKNNNDPYDAPEYIIKAKENTKSLIFNKYDSKLKSVPIDISCLLIKIAGERP